MKRVLPFVLWYSLCISMQLIYADGMVADDFYIRIKDVNISLLQPADEVPWESISPSGLVKSLGVEVRHFLTDEFIAKVGLNNRVIFIEVLDPSVETPKGIRIGSNKNEILKKYPTAKEVVFNRNVNSDTYPETQKKNIKKALVIIGPINNGVIKRMSFLFDESSILQSMIYDILE